MQKNKTTDWEKELTLYLTSAGDRRRTVSFIHKLLSQERKQWEEELREKIEKLDQYAEVDVSTDTVTELLSKSDVFSLLESGKDIDVPSKIESKEEKSE